MAFAKILVCIDGSDSSLRAADLAVEVAKAHGSELVAVSVIVSQLGYSYSSGMIGMSSQSAINDLLSKAKQEAAGWFSKVRTAAEAGGVTLKTEVLASPTAAAPAIVDYAEKNGVDLIVTGTRGRSGLSKLLLGSVASGIVTSAACPVMVVK